MSLFSENYFCSNALRISEDLDFSTLCYCRNSDKCEGQIRFGKLYYCGMQFYGPSFFDKLNGYLPVANKNLPKSNDILGWRTHGAPRQYSGKDIISYKRDEAQLLTEYEFENLVVQHYRDKRDRSVQVDLYKMKSAYCAYGIFTYNLGLSEKPIRISEGMLVEDRILFCAGDYYVSITGSKNVELVLPEMKKFARYLSSTINSEEKRPPIVFLLPVHGLNETSIRYFLGKLALEKYFFCAALPLSHFKEAIMGRYVYDYSTFIICYDRILETRRTFSNIVHSLQNSRDCSILESGDKMMNLSGPTNNRLHLEIFRNHLLMMHGRFGKIDILRNFEQLDRSLIA